MTERTEVSVAPESPGWYRVDVRRDGGATSHRVEVPAGLASELGWGQDAGGELVRESFAFLLEREEPASILRTFRLDVIGRYFPEYPAEIRSRAPRR